MAAISTLILTGYGLNCEAESREAWQRAGARTELVHLNDLLEEPALLRRHQIMMFIGGFPYGDHMGSGHVLARRLQHHLREEMEEFIAGGGLLMGVCNGFQVLVRTGLLPAFSRPAWKPRLALLQNECGVFQDRWVDLAIDPDSPCVFTRGLRRLTLPVRHGEGRLFTLERALLDEIDRAHLAPCRYADPVSGRPACEYPANPNGSLRAIAGLCDPTGRIFGLMPHPEAYLFPENHPDWPHARHAGGLPAEGAGIEMFRNAVRSLR